MWLKSIEIWGKGPFRLPVRCRSRRSSHFHFARRDPVAALNLLHCDFRLEERAMAELGRELTLRAYVVTAEGPKSTLESRTIFARTKAIVVVCEKTLSRHFNCLVTWMESCPVCIFINKMCAKCHVLAKLLILPLRYFESGSSPRSPLSSSFRSVICCFVFSSRISGGLSVLGKQASHHQQ